MQLQSAQAAVSSTSGYAGALVQQGAAAIDSRWRMRDIPSGQKKRRKTPIRECGPVLIKETISSR
jgi:hypothetical protein